MSVSTPQPPPPSERILRLKEMHLHQVADPNSDYWKGLKGIQMRVFAPNNNDEVLALTPGRLIYRPRFPMDWTQHPRIVRALEVLSWDAEGERPLTITSWQPGAYLFLVPDAWGAALLRNERTEQELLLRLSDQNPPSPPLRTREVARARRLALAESTSRV